MSRINILKTYKIFINGELKRTESGRFFEIKNQKGNFIANACLASRKDFRNAVIAARNAQKSWANTSSLNRGQILYRVAEMLEGRKSQFLDTLMLTMPSKKKAKQEIEESIDRLIYYAGWSDKYSQVYSSVNPVASKHFNFSIPQAMGVVSIITSNHSPLLGLVSTLAPVIVGGNTCILLASESNPISSICFAEVLSTSDIPQGVVNILTGKREELLEQFASHFDVNAIIYCGKDSKDIKSLREMSSLNLKRVILYKEKDWLAEDSISLDFIQACQEIKTIWHPTEI